MEAIDLIIVGAGVLENSTIIKKVLVVIAIGIGIGVVMLLREDGVAAEKAKRRRKGPFLYTAKEEEGAACHRLLATRSRRRLDGRRVEPHRSR